MPTIQEDVSLKPYHTFGVEATARFFSSFENITDLTELLEDKAYSNIPKLYLGGGSNILFTDDFEGLVIKNDIPGIEIPEETDEHCLIRVGAGENWDELVEYTVGQGWGGLENLSYIPGNVGACPIQNIGAYGVEVKDIIQKVETLDTENLEKISYFNPECRFDYRSSIFKYELKDKRIVTHVIFKLTKKNHRYRLDYENLKQRVAQKGTANLHNIREAVIEIRQSKLPDPEEVGNAGSFFKNPLVNNEHFKKLQSAYPYIPYYPLNGNRVKIPAGWMIDRLGWKGYREGDAGVHSKQALVLVNYGNATGRQIFDLSRKILDSVQSKFGIELEYEVNIV